MSLSVLSYPPGTPYLHVNETDLGFFLMDDWRFRPNLTLSAGVRYEVQNHLGDHSDVAPRLGFAWSPGSGKTGPLQDRHPRRRRYLL